MEILKGHSGSVKFVVPSDLTTATAKAFRSGEQVGPVMRVTPVAGVAEVNIPYGAVVADGEVTVELRFIYQGDPYTNASIVTVATPLLNLWEVEEILENIDKKEAIRAEAAARHIISAHCGQQFGLVDATYSASGNGGSSLPLPSRLLSLTSVSDYTDTSVYEIQANGFYLKYYPFGIPPVKADYYGLHQHVGGVIHNPNHVTTGRFKEGYSYHVKGTWGYNSVPEEVKEAARLLVGMYDDQDSEYRDRYLTSMTAADWRIQFNSGAFSQTGHVRADQLLADYVLRRGWAIL